MGDLADDFRKIHKRQGWECLVCDGSGQVAISENDEWDDCPRCGGDGIEPGNPLKDDEEES